MPIVIDELDLEIIPEQEQPPLQEPATGTGEDSRQPLQAKQLQNERQCRLEVD